MPKGVKIIITIFINYFCIPEICQMLKETTINDKGGGPRVVVSTAAFHARVRGSVPGLGGLKETKIVSSPSTCES